MLEIHNHSSYPRIGDTPHQQRLRRAHHELDSGKISQEEFNMVLEDYIKEVMIEQLKYVQVPTDGQLRWYDPISHIPKKLGVKAGQLKRFFDTNFYYREPVFESLEFGSKNGFIVDEYLFAKKISDRVKVVITGIYTITKMSQIKVDREKLLEKLVDIYRAELERLKANGYPIIQLEQPAILQNKKDIKYFKEVVKAVIRDYKKIILTTYFGDVTEFVEDFYDILDCIGFDLTYSPGVLKKLGVFKGKDVLIGVVDGRNTRLENPLDVAKLIEKFMKYARKVSITTSCGLDYLPRAVAIKKLDVLKKARKLING